MALWQKMFATNVIGPVALTKALLPSMRAAGRGPHRPGVQRGRGTRHARHRAVLRGQGRAGAVGRIDGRARSRRSVSASPILVTGTYDTDIITDAGTTDDRDFDGPVRPAHNTMNSRGRFAMKVAARSPQRFAAGLVKALDGTEPFVRRPVGPDARMLLIANRLLPAAGIHQMTRLMMGIPRFGGLRPDERAKRWLTPPILVFAQAAHPPRSVSNRR